MTTIIAHLPETARAAAQPGGHTTGVMRYRSYWIVWTALLVLTAIMLMAETVHLTRWVAVSLLLAAMTVKAGVIAAWFMHLRFERAALVISVVGGTVLTGLALFALIAPDGMDALRHAAP
jgi:caa(3)-type oxidase subunit IV